MKKLLTNKKFSILILFLITLIGFIFRLYKSYKFGGLWTDEMFTYHIINSSPIFGVIQKVLDVDVQPPLYYLLLNLWTQVFGDGDFVLRFFSILFGTLTIPLIYLAGKELYSQQVGFIAAALASVNSLLIFYSQEVRLYSFLTLLGTLSILFLLKIKNNHCLKNYIGLIITNSLILYTASIGMFFIFWQTLLFLLYLYFSKKEVKKFIYAQLITLGIFLPYLPVLIKQSQLILNIVISPFDAYSNKISDIFVYLTIVFRQWFTPAFGLPPVYPGLENKFILLSIFFVLPIIIYLIGISKSFRYKKFNIFLCLMVFFFILTQSILAANGKFSIESRYTIIILPILILLASYGLTLIKKRSISICLIATLIGINLVYLIHSPYSAANLHRVDSYKVIANILNQYSFNKQDKLVMICLGELLYRYYDKTNLFPLEVGVPGKDYNNRVYGKFLSQEQLKKLNRNTSYEVLQPYIGSHKIPTVFQDYLQKELINKVDKGRYVIIVVSKLYSRYNPMQLQIIANNEEIYKKYYLFFLLQSKINSDILYTSYSQLKPVQVINENVWEIHILQKP